MPRGAYEDKACNIVKRALREPLKYQTEFSVGTVQRNK
jgi:hypothetical protein